MASVVQRGVPLLAGLVVAATVLAGEARPAYQSPYSVVMAGDGARLYVSHHTAGAVSAVDPAARKVVWKAAVGGSPTGLALSPDGAALYVADADSGYDGAHVVYSRNWVTPEAYQDGVLQKQAEIEKAMSFQGWTTTAERMANTDNAIYTHPMPVDRGSEVTDEVASGPRSAIYDIAENRLHVQKAVMALTMGNY